MTLPIGALSNVSGIAGALPVAATPAAAGTGGASFSDALGKGLDAVASAQSQADSLAVQAATGSLTDISQYTVAASKAQVMTEFTSALRTKAVDAFNTIMGMQA